MHMTKHDRMKHVTKFFLTWRLRGFGNGLFNENYMNDVNGPPSQVEPRPAGERLDTSRSSFSKTPMVFES